MQHYFNFFDRKTSSEQFRTYTFAKIFLYFDILTWSPILDLGSSLLFLLSKSIMRLTLYQQASF